jgi:hypothetical protein
VEQNHFSLVAASFFEAFVPSGFSFFFSYQWLFGAISGATIDISFY